MNFVVLSSSKGTVFKSVIDKIADGSLHAVCLGLVSDRDDRGCVSKARAAKIRVMIVEKRDNEPREKYDKRLQKAILELASGNTENAFVACMGWMFLLSPWFVTQWNNKIINVHPSLLPKYPGTHPHGLVLENNDKQSGMTIHLIDEGVDTGKILMQKECPVLPDDTEDTLKTRVQELEKEWYPKVLEMIEEGTLQM